MPSPNPSSKTSSYTTTLHPPPGRTSTLPLTLPTRTIPNPPTNPNVLNDALAVRLEVFVDEQNCAAEFEIDDDDSRSWHWVIYDNNKQQLPVGVVRLVPPPHASHESFVAAYAAAERPENENEKKQGGGNSTAEAGGYDLEHEPYIKFGRVAVLAAYRGSGVARRVIEEATEWAEGNAEEINRGFIEVFQREGGTSLDLGGAAPVWKGLALVHAQVDVERFYARLGFVTDESLGRWVEEGIEHVGMWKRLDVKG